MSTYIIINIALLIAIVALIFFLSKKTKSEASYVKSDITNKSYLVQNLPNKEEAAHILGIIDKRISVLDNYLKENINKFPEYKPYIEQFNNRIKKLTLYENAPDGKYTSFTVDKGKEIALCLRSRKTGQIHDINLVMYVTLHELAHVACPETDHTELFKKIFIFLIKISVDLNIYKHIDYEADPAEYCGLVIDEDLLK
ncbi:putative metallopeptidase WLM domain protein [Acanthamoeba polyphaga mimivirus]|uniref:Metallopeptidase WLM domain protein n=1 Tax=Acanthamoeba polyphaga mimivirus Kroon TaxID=3069720 RepID=A0A0G2Y689_9VIRU|nr:putative metallopeptidase WLM domain protein [Acanthamoeba polyphaga mimivirus]AKI80059.1 putative metallopeptidase WLM domain protein [Acanthamoeba polyphaga mimivirus Kroon]